MSLHLGWNFCRLLLLIWDSPFEPCSCPSSQDRTHSYCELSSQPWRTAKVQLHKAVSSEVKSALSDNRHLAAWLVCHALCNERWLFILIYLHMLLIAASLIFFSSFGAISQAVHGFRSLLLLLLMPPKDGSCCIRRYPFVTCPNGIKT